MDSSDIESNTSPEAKSESSANPFYWTPSEIESRREEMHAAECLPVWFLLCEQFSVLN